MLLLAVQFGLQPILYKEFASSAKSSAALVIACELCKLAIACLVLVSSGDFFKLVKSWELKQSLRASGLPACTYAMQNVLVQISYQHLPPIVFNLINQTKLLWTALFVFALLGTKFSRQQCGAMVVLLAAAVLLSLAKESGNGKGAGRAAEVSFELGLLPVLVASILSGFGAAITQRSMQIQKRDLALVTIELSVYGSVFLVLPMLWSAISPLSASSDSLEEPLSSWASLWEGCDAFTLIPVVTNAFGGLLVGTVTKHVGGVLKSFALICGIAFTAFVESYVYGAVLPMEVYVAAALVAFSLFLYSSYPYKEAVPTKKKTQ
ncbi:Cmp-sialic acid transporter 5-like, partial [Globisporangium splendens]